MNIKASRIWSLEVGKGPAEHGVYRDGNLYLAPTYNFEFWKVDPEKGSILKSFKMPGHVWGAPWVDETALYGASTEGYAVKFSLEGDILWKSNLGLGHFFSEAVTETWSKYIAVQFAKGIAILDKSMEKLCGVTSGIPRCKRGKSLLLT